MADWLALQGHELRVITTPPYYPEWRLREEFSRFMYSSDTAHKSGGGRLVVYRCPLWVPREPSGLRRILHLSSFAISSIPVVISQLLWRPDAVLVIAPTFLCAPAGWLAARVCGAKAWLHIQDFEVDAAFSLGILKNRALRSLVLAVERMLLRRFDRVSSISVNMVQMLSAKGVAAGRQVTFPNWVDLDTIYPLDGASPLRDAFGISQDDTVVLYSGNLGEKQGLDVLLDAAALLVGNHGIRFVICGEGVERRKLEQRYGGLANVIWRDLQPLAQLNALLNLADIHALPQRAGAADLVMPSKLTGMMASGRPTVAAATPGTEIALAVEGAGMLVPPGDAAAFAKAIEHLAGTPALRLHLGKSARMRAIDLMGKEAILGRFHNDLAASLT